MKKSIIILIVIILAVFGFAYFSRNNNETPNPIIPDTPIAATMDVKVYFNRPLVGSEDCDAIQTPITRTIPQTEGVARAAILELLKGPISSDGNLETSIPVGVALNKIEIRNETAYVDFNDKLTAGGSCRVTAIRAQIEDTLKQFSTVKNVIISVDGRMEDILQP